MKKGVEKKKYKLYLVVVSLVDLLGAMLGSPKCHSESEAKSWSSQQVVPSFLTGRPFLSDMAMPALFIRNMPVLAWSKSKLFMEILRG